MTSRAALPLLMLPLWLPLACEHPEPEPAELAAPAEPSVARAVAPPPIDAAVAPPIDAAVALPPGADPVLRAVSWCNRRYDDRLDLGSDCRGESAQRHAAGEGIWGFETFRLANVVYGDLTGDGAEDALLVFEIALRPVTIQPKPPPIRGQLWVMQRRGDDLIRYTEDDTDSPPTSVAIDNGVATLVWDDHVTRCTQDWRLAGVGELAVKTARTCRRARAARPGSP